MMLRHTMAALLTLALVFATADAAWAHCQVPCGIYHDHERVKMMREDIETITKAAGQIRALSAKRDSQSQNQLVRWVMTKEQHAERVMRTISDYFMAQKIKPVVSSDRKGLARYQQMLVRHHQVMVAAMQCKQSASPEAALALGRAVDGIAGYWKH